MIDAQAILASRGIAGLIQRAQRVFGEDKLSGGNCGTFAMALATVLAGAGKKAGKPPTIGFLYSDVGFDVGSARELQDAETDIYHVVLEIGGKLYDGTGKTSRKALLALARDQYGDSHPAYLGGMKPDKQTFALIRTETNWDIAVGSFYAKIT